MKSKLPFFLLAALLLAAMPLYGSLAEESNAIRFNGTEISAASGAVQVDGKTATITAAGTYILTGTLTDGQIIVDVSNGGTVTLVLDGAHIACSDGPAIYIKAVSNAVLELADGSENTVSDGTAYLDAQAEADAAIFSKADLTITGQGALTVQANTNDGIASRDTLLIESGSLTVTAPSHGIKGKDYLIVNGGALRVTAGGDGIKSTNDTQASLGYVEVNGGTLDITAVDDGISAVTSVTISGGAISIHTENNGIKSDGIIALMGGAVTIETEDDGLVCQSQTGSSEATLTVNGKAVSVQ